MDFKFTNLNKIYWPQEGYTKGDVLAYYMAVGPVMLRHIKDRPVSLKRFPDGIKGKSFFQKKVPAYAPQWIRRELLGGQEEEYFVGEDLAGILWFANQGAIEIHSWLSRWNRVDEPDYAVIDLDPGERTDWGQVMKLVLLLQEVLAYLDLVGFPKTSGGRGLHVYIPVERGFCYEDSVELVQGIGKILTETLPEEVSLYERRVKERTDKIYIDYLQNGRKKTMISPYSLRPFPAAPVSMPIFWSDMKKGLTPHMLNINTVPLLIKERGDAFASLEENRRNIREALARLGRR